MTDSLTIALIAAALQASGLPPSLRQDIEAAGSVPSGPKAVLAMPPGVAPAIPDLPAIVPLPPAPPPPPPGPEVFGMSATPHKIGLDDNRWIRIGSLPSRSPILAALFSKGAKLRPYQLANFVQATVNTRLAYKLDQDNWGVPDYWATADETVARGAGDCEDLALVKLQALRLLGFNERDMFLMTGKRGDEDHALLLVRIEGRFWVMEDGLNRIVAAESFHTFKPAVTYGAGWKWVHGAPQVAAPSPSVASATMPRVSP